MKILLVSIGLLALTCSSYSQTKYGIAFYLAPKGWSVVQNPSNVTFEEQRKDGKISRIILYATDQVAIDNQSVYLSSRKQKNEWNFSYTNTGSVERKENSYCIAYISTTLEEHDSKQIKCSFFSFTNKKESFCVQFLAEDGINEAVFNAFIKSLEVEEAVTTDSRTRGKPRGRPRKNPA